MKKVFLGVLTLSLFACKGPRINIYILASLTGPEAAYGKQAKEGAQLLYEEIKREKIRGKEINVIFKDIKDITEIKKTVEEIGKDKNAICIIGPEISKFAIVAGAVAEKEKIPLFTPTATHPLVTQEKDYVFRLTYTDPLQGSYMAKFAIFNLKKKKAAILFEANNTYSEELARQFEATYKKEGGEILYSTFYIKDDTTFDAQIESFEKFKPDVIFIPGYIKEVIYFLKEAYKKGLKAIYLGGDGWHSPEIITSLKDLWIKGIEAYITTPFSPYDTSKITQEFVNKFKKKYGRIPEAVSALYYDALSISIYIIKNLSRIERNEFRKTLLNLKEFIGVTGKVSFDGKNDPERDIFILKPEPTDFKYITKLYFK